MPSDWGNPGDTSQSLERLADLLDEMADSTGDDEELRVTKDSTDPSSIAKYATQFNDVNTVDRKEFINLNSSQGISSLRDIITTENGGTVSANTVEGEIEISTDSQSNSFAKLETARWGQYTPGFEAEMGIGVRLPQQPTDNGDIKWGYFNGQNGFYFGYDSSGLYVAIVRNGSEQKKTYRDNWNGRDPNVIDGVDFQPNEGAIFQINYAWYGYGSIQFSIISSQEDNPQRKAIVHTLSLEEETSISNPNQPIEVRVDNNSSSNAISAYIGGRQFSILGDITDNFRISSETITDVSVDNGSWTHIGTIRRKSTDDRRVNLLIDGFEANAGDDARLALVVDANISSTSYTDFELIPSDETIAEVSSAGTFDGIGQGTKAIESFIPVGQNSKSAVADPIRELNQPIPRDYPLSLIAKGVGTSTTVDAVMRVREQW
jgi:hypothetical protein